MFLPFAGWAGSFLASMAAFCACQACQCASRELLTHSARIAWSSLFFLGMVTAWLLRDFAKPLLERIPWIVAGHMDFGEEWFGQQAVYRISMGQFLFFATLSAVMAGIKFRGDKRDRYLHHGHCLTKLGLWLVFSALPFLLPNNIVNGYAMVARVGSGLFLVIQMIILLDFVQNWNDSWVAAAEDERSWLYYLLAVTIGAYVAFITLAGLMYYWFKPAGAGSCSFNVALITISLLLCVAFSLLSLAPAAKNGSIFPSAIISLYCMYLCFSALQSEPKDYECNGIGQKITTASGSTLALGMLVTLLSVVYAAFRAGSNTRIFSLEDSMDGDHPERTALLDEEALTSSGLDGVPEGQRISRDRKSNQEENDDDVTPISYNYAFFHLIFALASMYIAMLMTGWGSTIQEKDRIDVGWSSVWIKSVAEWTTALLYAWTLIAPIIFPERSFA